VPRSNDKRIEKNEIKRARLDKYHMLKNIPQ